MRSRPSGATAWLAPLAWLGLGALSASTPVLACAVCGVYGDDPSNLAFLQGTALLSLVPLAIMGGTVYFIWYRVKQARREVTAIIGPGDNVRRLHLPDAH